jgi:short subunit dehydrogenase-like uncharacterized protein
MTARHDIVVYGATGFTGRQAARYLDASARAGAGIRLAIAGRDEERLHALKRRLLPDTAVLTGDARDVARMDEIAAGARVVLNTAGPFAALGDALVSACARRGTDYVDICGETAHVRRLIDRHHGAAAASGAKIVPMCGFDSAPSDLGALLLAEHFRGRGAATREVKGFFRLGGGWNGGTLASMLELWRRPDDQRAMANPTLLDPPSRRRSHAKPDPSLPVFDADLGRWVAPFFMGPINTRVVRRSAALASEWGAGYGRDFQYQEFWDVGGPAPLLAACGAAWSLGTYRAMARMPGSAGWLAPFVRAPGEGPSEAEMDRGWFQARFCGIAGDGSKAWAELSDRGDPGNRVTVKIACEAALALALERDDLPGGAARAGLLTPATALGIRLVERLRATGTRILCPARGPRRFPLDWSA